jgi:hypothetical protein
MNLLDDVKKAMANGWKMESLFDGKDIIIRGYTVECGGLTIHYHNVEFSYDCRSFIPKACLLKHKPFLDCLNRADTVPDYVTDRQLQAIEQIVKQILEELDHAKELHPDYPTDMIHQVAIVAEEAGELLKAVLDYQSGKCEATDIIKEALQVGAMAVRFLENVKFERV